MRPAARFCVLALAAVTAAPLARGAVPMLNKTLPEVRFQDVAFSDALEFLRDTTQMNLVIDWAALEQVGVGKDTPVSLRLRNAKVQKVMTLLLEAAGPGLLAIDVDDNIVNVTTRIKADDKVITVVYPVADLLLEIPDFKGPKMSLTDSNSGGGRNGGSGGSGSGSSSGGLFNNENAEENGRETRRTRVERAEELIDLIKTTIRPEVWDTNGGRARIKYFNNNLIITAPRSIQSAIAGR
ncbi:MAG TPA: hypothetical protein VF624_19330 [Tepidisphaeraceae bacterium]|jgi:uncharacterized membrane protein YgcG